MRSNSSVTDLLGFLIGFFLGCCGLTLTALMFRDYLRGALLGFTARIMLGVALGAVSELSAPGSIPLVRPDGTPVTNDIPWELVGAFGIGTVAVAVVGAALVRAFGGSDDDDDDDEAPPENHEYVSYTR